MNAPSLPRLAMVLGDPAGIGPELIARLLADTEVREQAHIVLIADEAEMRRGMRIAGCEFPYRRIDALETLDFADATAGTSSHAAKRAPSVAATAWKPSRWPSN
ncbi:4-hydroxythreonine-4-phosphate dehydrogenase [Klebsiella pneumoniae]|nr:4-hydroxythreonine-4-phosphate dehydrogenase [Klebsiella pneumoniae]